MRLKSEHMPLECGETDHTVSNSFQNDVFSAHFTFQEEKGKGFLSLEGDIVIFKDKPNLRIAGCKNDQPNKGIFIQHLCATMLFDNC